MIAKQFNEIEISDFQNLIDNGVSEGKTIEYKQEVILLTDSEKKEFLYDISSFSNAGGGDIIIGIKENRETGLPEKLDGFKISNSDEFILKTDSLIRDGLAPRITGVQMANYQLPNGNFLVLIRVPKSWNSPHQVIFKGADKFYSRSTNGKYKLDVNELRNAFILNDTVTDRVRKFREERLSKIISDEMPVQLLTHSKISILLIPISSFDTNKIYEISSASIQSDQLRPLGGGGRDSKYNLEGRICYASAEKEKGTKSYLHLYRNGIVETVNSEILSPYDGQLLIPSVKYYDFEKDIIDFFNDYRSIVKALKIDFPIYAFVTFIGVKNYSMEAGSNFFRYGEKNKIDRDILNIPEILIEDINFNSEKMLKPVFDMIWNACGFEKSLHYDNNDNKIGPK